MKDLSVKKILVTGGSGFIGTYLTNKLCNQGNMVFNLDINPPVKNVDTNLLKYIEGDIRNKEVFKSLESVDLIYHLAAQTSSIVSERDSNTDLMTNIIGTNNLCEFATQFDCKIHFTSSMAVYGSGEVNRNSRPMPTSIYGISKLSAENLIKKYFNANKYCIHRLFNVYGPGQDLENLDQGMLSIFVKMALSNEEIKVKGSSTRTRDFIHVRDVIDFMINADIDGQINNIATGKSISVEKLVDKIMNFLNSRGRNVSVKYTNGFAEDINKILCLDPQITNFQYDIDSGLEEFIFWAMGALK